MEAVWPASLAIVTLAGGLVLGFRRPIVGLAVLVGCLVPMSSLPWHFGTSNLVLGLVYAIGLIAGAFANRQNRGHTAAWLRRHPLVAVSMIGLIACICTATILAAVRSTPPPPSGTSFLSNLLLFNAPGPAGRLQAALIALCGPATFLVAIGSIRTEQQRRFLAGAWVGGLLIVVISPSMQWLFGASLSPRPDLGLTAGGTGWVAFFQDPHSFAAYLILGLFVCTGAIVGLGSGHKCATIMAVLIIFAIVVLLLLSNSTSGVIASSVALVFLAASVAGFRSTRRARLAAGVTAVLMGGILLALLFWGPARNVMWLALRDSPADRVAVLFAPDRLPSSMLSSRVFTWKKALVITRQRPLWGLGPGGFQRSDIEVLGSNNEPMPSVMRFENVHNYFLQSSAELGIPGVMCLVLALGSVLGLTLRQARFASATAECNLLLGSASSQLGFLIISVASHPLLVAELQAAYWTLAAVSVAHIKLLEPQEKLDGDSQPAQP